MADQVSLAGWSLVRRFRRQDEPLTLLQFPRIAREEFGFEAIELNSPFFVARDDAYLAELRARTAEAGVIPLGIAVDAEGDLAGLDEGARALAVRNHITWFDIAATLGCRFVRANLGGRDTPDEAAALRAGIASFTALARAAGERGVVVTLENHWGLSTSPESMVRVFDAVASPHLGALVDFGNFPADTRYASLARIAPYAVAAHAKFGDFDEAGEPIGIDIARCIGILRDANYSGTWGIEFEGRGDERDGIPRAKSLLSRLLDQPHSPGATPRPE